MKDIHKLFADAKRETLSEHERAASRESLKLFMKEHPAEAPFALRASDYFASRFSSIHAAHFMRLHPVALSVILILGVGVGTSYAAEGTVPGDTLYPVKIHVNESVQTALAVSDEAKIDWSIRQVHRRLDEAEKLAYRGALSEEKRSEIEARIEKSAARFDTAVLSIADTPDPAVVADAAADFEVALSEKERAFERIATSPSVSKDSVAPITKRLRAKVEKAQRVRAVAARFAEKEGHKRGVKVPTGAGVVGSVAEQLPAQATLMEAVPTAGEATTGAIEVEIASTSIEFEAEIEVERALDFRAAILEAQGEREDEDR